MDKTVDMLNFLRGTGQVEINNLKIPVRYKDALGKVDIYFVCGLGDKKQTRCNDDDIKTKKYYVVDIDIRLMYYQKHGVVLSQEELQKEIENIITEMKANGFGDYSYSCDSGNGLHLYFAGTERSIDKETYSYGVSYIYEQIDQIIYKLGYKCDPACTNISRIMRLPGTINPRRKEKDKKVLRDLGPYECKILEEQPQTSFTFDGLEDFAEHYRKMKQEDKEAQIKIKQIIKTEYKNPDNIWKQINDIPAYQIAEDIWGVTLIDRGLDNVALKEDKKNMGAYRYKPHNVIVNTGSSMIKTDKNYFTSYELVYYEYANQDKRATLEYFKTKHNITINEEKKSIIDNIPKKKYKLEGYLYGNEVFDVFDCCMSGELVTVIAETNVGKTSFAMDMIQVNTERNKKCFYINLEFPIETVYKQRRLFFNDKKKRNLTDISPLSDEEEYNMEKYVETQLSKFKYHNAPNGMSIDELVDLIIKKNEEGYGMFVIDTFSRIAGNLDSKIAHSTQNKSMEVLQELCQSLGVTIINLHHTNKKGEFEGSKKIMDLSNVFIFMSRGEDDEGRRITKYELSKDKFVNKVELETYYVDQKPSLNPPPPPF